MMKRIGIVLLCLLLATSVGLSLSADDIFTRLIDVNQDLTSAEMTYEFCNPFEGNVMYPMKMISNNIYAKTNAVNLPEINDNVNYLINYSKPIYTASDVRTRITPEAEEGEPAMLPYYIDTIGEKISSYSEDFRELTAKDVVKAGECVKIRQKVTGEPRFRDVDGIDIVPFVELDEIDNRLESKTFVTESIVEQKKWAWWNIKFMNRSRLYVINENDFSFSSLPITLNATLSGAESDGTDIRVVCNSVAVEHSVKPYGSSIYGIRFRIPLEASKTNKNCYLYWNPTETVDNTSSDWGEMQWNLWLNFTENYYDWRDYLDNDGNFYMTYSIGNDHPSGYCILSTSDSRPMPTFTGIVVPNRIEMYMIAQANHTGNDIGFIFGESVPSNAPDTGYKTKVYKASSNNRIDIYKDNSNLLYRNQSSGQDYLSWFKHYTTWNASNTIFAKTTYMNGTEVQTAKVTDIDYVQGSFGFEGQQDTCLSLIAYRQVGDYSYTLNENESIVPVNGSVGNISNVDVDWGDPTNQQCINSNQLEQEWVVVINDKLYTKSKIYMCEYGCVDNECAISPEQEAMNEFWVYAIFIAFFIAIILVYLYIKR